MAREGSKVPILDIRPPIDKTENSSLRDGVRTALNPADGSSKTLPSLLLYDEKGLKLFEDITYLDEYYLTNAEIEALTLHAAAIASRIPSGSRLVELGSGNLRKINILLRALDTAQKEIEYYALDVSRPELERTFALVDTTAYQFITLHGLHGTYDDGLNWLVNDGRAPGRTTCLMTFGSSIGNFTPSEAAAWLASWRAQALGPADLILVGLDACQIPDRVFRAYNDSRGVTEKFYRNGLDHANRLLGYTAFKQDDWAVEGRFDQPRHHAAYVALKNIHTKDLSVEAGERLPFEHSYKYSRAESDNLWRQAGLIQKMAYSNSQGDYNVHVLSPAKVEYPEKAIDYAADPVPSMTEWQSLWNAWDIATRAMVPQDELLNKPIQLRNNLIFYLGHIPAFADIVYCKSTDGKPTDPASYHAMFERGIDPDVDDPGKCHAHSEIPDEWPPLDDMLEYQVRVRTRIADCMKSGRPANDRRLRRGLWLMYEHEGMHLETFLYMLLQSDKVQPPPGSNVDFADLAAKAASRRVVNQWHHVPASKVKVGIDDPENDEGPDRYFGWDIERSDAVVAVKAFEAQSRPISNGEYAYFLETTNKRSLPASWVIEGIANSPTHEYTNGHTNGYTNGHAPGDSGHAGSLKMASTSFIAAKAVRTVYGPVPLKYALDWPVMASYDELAAYAQWANGRIPTFEEVRSIYNLVDSRDLKAQEVPSKLISAVNGHLSNEGVEESPPSGHSLKNGANGTHPNPNDLFADLGGCNIGFKEWHPTAVTGNGNELCGQGDVGGLWEWTSTTLFRFDNFKPMDLYPAYSADFFDHKHNICLGGSWATVPRIAGRKTFVNWYQHNYPYSWCTARLVRDVA